MFPFYQLDLANASAGGEIVAVTDEFFAECKNMIKPEPALFCPGRFTGMPIYNVYVFLSWDCLLTLPCH